VNSASTSKQKNEDEHTHRRNREEDEVFDVGQIRPHAHSASRVGACSEQGFFHLGVPCQPQLCEHILNLDESFGLGPERLVRDHGVKKWREDLK
jgi:hypothetical protein